MSIVEGENDCMIFRKKHKEQEPMTLQQRLDSEFFPLPTFHPKGSTLVTGYMSGPLNSQLIAEAEQNQAKIFPKIQLESKQFPEKNGCLIVFPPDIHPALLNPSLTLEMLQTAYWSTCGFSPYAPITTTMNGIVKFPVLPRYNFQVDDDLIYNQNSYAVLVRPAERYPLLLYAETLAHSFASPDILVLDGKTQTGWIGRFPIFGTRRWPSRK